MTAPGVRIRGRAGQRMRSRRLARTSGLCERCLGINRWAGREPTRTTIATVVNHIVPLAHSMHTLAPWGGRIEQSAEVNLLSEREQLAGLEVKVNLAALMRGDFKSRQEGLQIMRRNGVINANTWLALEDMDPREDEGGDQYIVEGNMAVQDGRDLVPTKTIVAQ